ncbi:MAG TPA: hypothetical protein PKV71_11825, partial [Calditrichia bacterium]|nr:hypothetical protein [Calditrichia bacterium]
GQNGFFFRHCFGLHKNRSLPAGKRLGPSYHILPGEKPGEGIWPDGKIVTPKIIHALRGINVFIDIYARFSGPYPLPPRLGKGLSLARTKLKRLSCFRDFAVYDRKWPWHEK